MKRIRLITAFLGLIVSGPTLAGIEIFTASHIPLADVPVEAVVVELNALAGMEELLSADLPDSPAVAEHMLRQRFASDEFKRLERRYHEAAHAVARAWALGIEKLPAVVVDGQFVVYGEPNASTALESIRRSRR